jgi:hypothetical protein
MIILHPIPSDQSKIPSKHLKIYCLPGARTQRRKTPQSFFFAIFLPDDAVGIIHDDDTTLYFTLVILLHEY